MDPISVGLAAVGLGMQLFGGLAGASTAKQSAQVSMDIAGQEQGINSQKNQQMKLEAQRAQLENFRNLQRARAQGLNSATNQGAQFGTGLQGGQAQEQDQFGLNQLGLNQNLQIGENIFGYNQKISQDKIKLAQLGGQSATDAGIASLGGALVKSGPIIGAFGRNAGASSGSLGPSGGFNLTQTGTLY